MARVNALVITGYGTNCEMNPLMLSRQPERNLLI